MKIQMPDTSYIQELRALWKEAFGDTDTFIDTFFATAFSPRRSRILTIDGKVGAALYWFDCSYKCHRVAYIYAVATFSSLRGQGLCHRLMEDTHIHLKNLGYSGSILVPADDKLFLLYKKMDYSACCNITELTVTSLSDNGSSDNESDTGFITQISKAEFARRRRALLPEGSILQENENLDFLETQADFYVGNDFLLTARVENDTLYGLELLGDTGKASDIVHALGCTYGRFRIIGNDKPFAMYHSLDTDNSFSDNNSTDNGLFPRYFAFAFD